MYQTIARRGRRRSAVRPPASRRGIRPPTPTRRCRATATPSRPPTRRRGTQINAPISPIPEGRPTSGCSTRPTTAQTPGQRSSSRGTVGHGDLDAPPPASPSGRAAADALPRDLDMEDVAEEGVLGMGSSGVVKFCVHRPTGAPLVVKTIPFPVHDELVRKNVLAELKAMHTAVHPHVVGCYQSVLRDGVITLALEFMDCGSLERAFAAHPRGMAEAHLCEVARQVLTGLVFLHAEARTVHRDIKPSNLLLNSRGEVKIADFGVSGQLGEGDGASNCTSWVGTVTYMSPERIRGEPYRANADVWSLGLSLVQGALGSFPYASGAGGGGPSLGFWDVLDKIVEGPAPELPPGRGLSDEFRDFVARCLAKDCAARATSQELLAHPWLSLHAGATLAGMVCPVRVPRRPASVPCGAARAPPSPAPLSGSDALGCSRAAPAGKALPTSLASMGELGRVLGGLGGLGERDPPREPRER